MQLLRVLVVVASVVALAASGNSKKKESSTSEPDPWLDRKPEQARPADVAPTFRESRNPDKTEASRERAAQEAVYARCSTFAVWREGSELDGTYVFRKPGDPERVNVTVNLARKAQIANGNTLWYRVEFANGKPAKFRANKRISAELCGLGAAEVDVPL